MTGAIAGTLPEALDQAADWMVRLHSGRADAADRAAFDAWLGASSAHRNAWAQLESPLLAPLAALRDADRQQTGHSAAALHALTAGAARGRSARRRRLLGGTLAVLFGGAAGVAVHRQVPLDALASDFHTGTGERRHVALPDGSLLVLNARSAVDLRFDEQARRVLLRRGELLAQVTRGSLPFIVQTAHGEVRALGTRFVVRTEAEASFAAVLEHEVRVRGAPGGGERMLRTGEAADFGAAGIVPATVHGDSGTWVDGLLDVRDASLGEVIDALRPYSAGLIRVSPEAARLRVFGVFPLDRAEQVLQDLADTQPVLVRRWGPFLTRVELEPGGG